MNQQMTEAEEMAAACHAIGRDLEDIVVHDDWGPNGFRLAPRQFRYQATWGDPDLDCLTGSGATAEEAMWDLVDFTDGRA